MAQPRLAARLCAFAACLTAGVALPIAAAPASAQNITQDIPHREVALRLQQPVTARFQEQRLEDVLRFLQEVTNTQWRVYWSDETGGLGLDKDALVSVNAREASALAVLERVLSSTRDDFGITSAGGATWQFTEFGEFEVGARESLNQTRRVEIYPILDLITEIPDYPDAPAIDLESVLQAGEGGGGDSPFDNADQTDVEFTSPEERAEQLVEIIIRNVEPEQWLDAGGTAASIRFWRGNLIVNAPDYIHRGLNGYRWWPSARTYARQTAGRRWVSLSPDAGVSVIDGFENQPVTAVVPGAPGPG